MRIALDAMGGDCAPEVRVEGVIEALRDLPSASEILLVGRKQVLASALASHGGVPAQVRLIDAPDVIEMNDKPLGAVRGKPRSSIVVGLALQKAGEADAFISAGNTGAVMAASTLLLGLHPGIDRPAIATAFPSVSKPVLVLDNGANVNCGARELYGFAQIGAVYARTVLRRRDPVVGLLNVGTEEEKGSPAVKEAYALMARSSDFSFAGNVEGSDVLSGNWDVVVCDGFVGNVLLKFYESVANLFKELVGKGMEPSVLQSPGVSRAFRVLDYSEYGGAPLLGVRGISIICHGRSSPRAIRNAIGVAARATESRLSQHIGAQFAEGEAVA